jgi:hypothetical protein
MKRDSTEITEALILNYIGKHSKFEASLNVELLFHVKSLPNYFRERGYWEVTIKNVFVETRL